MPPEKLTAQMLASTSCLPRDAALEALRKGVGARERIMEKWVLGRCCVLPRQPCRLSMPASLRSVLCAASARDGT